MQAHKQKNESELQIFREKTNFTAWLQGIYFARAIAANFSKNTKYFDEPLNLQGQNDDAASDAARFEAWAIAFNRNIKNDENS